MKVKVYKVIVKNENEKRTNSGIDQITNDILLFVCGMAVMTLIAVAVF